MNNMKKVFTSILILLIFIVAFANTCIVVKASTSSNSYVTKEQYFSNLRNNFSQNKFGTCSYIVLENLLSYYDTFYNDDIIPEKYEVNSNNKSDSPGSYNDIDDVNAMSNKQEFINFCINNKEKYLIAKLVYIAVCELNYGFQFGSEQQINLLKYYLATEANLTENIDYTLNESSVITDETWIVNELKKGRIVITNMAGNLVEPEQNFQDVYIDDYDFEHSAIAYECGSSDNEFYMHYGYHSGDINTYRAGVTITRSNGSVIKYSHFYKCTSISMNVEHKHSKRYSTYVNSTKHISHCPCGYSEESIHNYEYIGSNTGKCKECLNERAMELPKTVISDPDSGTLCGTHVRLYNGEYRGTDLNTGLTRILYLTYDAPSVSRLDYEWKSDDENKAIVTKYGTVMGKAPGLVTIKAIYKNNPAIVATITLTIFKDDTSRQCYISMTTDIREKSFENGTEVTELNQPSKLFTIHSGYTRVLCFSETNIYPTIKDFNWSSSNPNVATVSIFGTVEAKNVNVETTVIITGVHKNNKNVKARIVFTILPN